MDTFRRGRDLVPYSLPLPEKNPNDRYCSIQAEPKVKKVREKFGEKVTQ